MEKVRGGIRRRNFLVFGGASLGGLISQKSPSTERKGPRVAGSSVAGGTVGVHSLDGTWHIATDPQNIGREKKWFNSGPRPDAKLCQVPDILERTFPGYDGVVWYWKEFDCQPAETSQWLLLKFHAADYLAHVWVNSTLIGFHEGGETPFSLDVTRAVKCGQKNRLVVRLLNPGNEPIDGITLDQTPHGIKSVPMEVGRFWNPGGLWQSVELLRVPAVRVTDIFADARLADKKIITEVSIANDTGITSKVRLHLEVAPAGAGPVIVRTTRELGAPAGESTIKAELDVPNVRQWSPDDPYLYRVTARLEGPTGSHVQSVRCGFREFVFRDGYFRLNGKRIYLKSAHSVGHFPIGQHVPHDMELLRRELIYAKTLGLNAVRWLGRTMFPSQLDLCDELGLMVYQETYASWLWKDSSQMKERFDRSVREMIIRDRNHPSVVIWGLLNETSYGPIFLHAVGMLPLVGSLDTSRMVLLNSGRHDRHPSYGSLANPRTMTWEYVLGEEHPGAPPSTILGTHGYFSGIGDCHRYVARPWSEESLTFFRTLGAKGNNIFLSEHGNGSQIDPVRISRLFEQNGARADLDDAKLYRSMLDQLEADWKRWGLEQIFTTPSDMVLEGERIHSEQRRIALNAIRSNPKLCGYNLTGLSDQAVEGEGLMTTFRELKRGVVDALTDGFAPLRWCLFAEPVHLYRGRKLHLEAVLANEDRLKPGDYPVKLRVVGPSGVAFEKTTTLTIPDPKDSPEPPIVFPVFKDEVVLDGSAGKYEVAVLFDRGAVALGRETVIVGDPASHPKVSAVVTVWDNEQQLTNWLQTQGVVVERFDPTQEPAKREVILVGGNSGPGVLGGTPAYKALMTRVARGSVAVFLSPVALAHKDEPLGHLPSAKKGKLVDSAGYYWGRDDIVKPHPLFDGLPSRCLMDLTFYRDIVAYKSFTEMASDAEVVVPCFALGQPGGLGYWSGANLVIQRFGAGSIIITTLRLLENLGNHPAGDRIVLNLVSFAAVDLQKPLAPTPPDLQTQFSAGGYASD